MRYIPLILLLAACAAPPKMRNAHRLAEWAKCDGAKVADYIDWRLKYEITKGWEPAEVCLEREAGDCKCAARIAQETLSKCVGYEARIVTVQRGKDLHAVTLYTDHKGRRGYISNYQHGLYAPGTPWDEVVAGIPGGWYEIQARTRKI